MTERSDIPAGRLPALRWVCGGVAAAAALVSAVFLAAMVCVVFAEIVARYGFARPLVWSSELAQLLTVYVALLGGAYAYRYRLHIGVTFLIERFPARLGRLWQRVLDAVIGLFGAAMIFYAVQLIGEVGHHLLPATGLRVWVAYLPLTLCGAMLCIFAGEALLIGPLPAPRLEESA